MIAVVGYSLTFWAWSLATPRGLAPHLWSWLPGSMTLLVALTVVIVGSSARIPVGVLTDKYGASVVLPCISVFAAGAVLLFTVVGQGPAMLAVAVPLCVGGTTFAAGAAVVVRAYPPGRRGVWLSVFGTGMGVASVAAIVSRQWVTVDRGTALPLLALALIGHAFLAAALLRDGAAARPDRAAPRTVLALLRLPATRDLSAWYAVAFGGVVAAGLYLPAYLQHAHDLAEEPAALITAAGMTLAAFCRPLGGWLGRCRDPVRLLALAFAGGAAALLALALHPGLVAAVVVLAVLAVCLGAACGIVQALLGDAAPPREAGAVAGTVGAVGGLAGVLPPVLLAATYGASGAYGVGLTPHAAVLAAAAWRVHRTGAVPVFPQAASAPPAATVVAMAPALVNRHGELASTVAAIAGLALDHELVVVLADGAGGTRALVTVLRLHLPRHRIVGVTASNPPHPHETGLVADLVAEGAVPVIESDNAELVGAHLAAALADGLVLHLGSTAARAPA